MVALLLLLSSAGIMRGLSDDAGTIRSAHELDDFLLSTHDEVRPFSLRGQVRQANATGTKFFLDDGSRIVRLVRNQQWPKSCPQNGDIVEVTGHTVRLADKAVNADCETIVKIGHKPLPPPIEKPMRNLLRDRGHPYRAVRVRGTVRDFILDDIDLNFASIVLTDDDTTLYLSLHTDHADTLLPKLEALVGAKISVDGMIRTDIRILEGNTSYGHRGLPLLFISGLDAIRVIQPAPADPFAVPSLDDLSPVWPEDLLTATRKRIDGKVLTSARTQGFLLETADGRLVNVDLASRPSPRFGEYVTAVGLPVTDLYRINLARAIWKHGSRTFDIPHTKPERVTISSLLTNSTAHTQYQIDSFGRRIRLSGFVRSLPAPDGIKRKVLIEDDGHILSLIAEPGIDPFADLALGMKIEATGICLMDIEPWRPGMPFPRIIHAYVAVQSPSGIVIISRPPWWTPRRLLILVCALGFAALAGIIGNVILRTIVIRRSRELLREQTKRLSETLRVDERTRLATELHDTVAQNLSGLSMQLDAAGRLADSEPATMKSILAFTSKSLLACRRELRDCLWDLRSQALNETSMNAAIRRALTPHIPSTTLTVRFNVPRRKVSDHTAHAILRILRELVHNAIQHGKAKTLRIAGSLDGEGLKFSCTDDGCGFDVNAAPSSAEGHFGLQGIRDRIRAFNGKLTISSSLGKGTRAVIILHPQTLDIHP